MEFSQEEFDHLRVMDDVFMNLVFDDHPEAIQDVLRIILKKPDLIVTEVHTKRHFGNGEYRGVEMDIYAIDAYHHVYNVELQKVTADFPFIRAEAHSANLLLTSMEKGKDWAELEETVQTTVITIFDNDPLGREKALYNVSTKWDDNGELIPAHQHILYVNGSYQGNDAFGTLMKDLHETDAGKISVPGLKERIRYLKNTEGGNHEMFEYFREHYGDELQAEYARGQKSGQLKMLRKNLQALMASTGSDLSTSMDMLGIEADMREQLMAELQKQVGINSN